MPIDPDTQTALTKIEGELQELEELIAAEGNKGHQGIPGKPAIPTPVTGVGPVYELMIASPPTIPTNNGPTTVLVSPDGNNVYVSCEANVIDIYSRDEDTGVLAHISTVATEEEPHLLGFSPEEDILYVGCRAKQVQVWARGETGLTLVETLETLPETQPQSGCASRDGSYLYVGDANYLVVCTTEPLTKQTEILLHDIYAVLESEDGNYLYVLDSEKPAESTVRVYRRNTTTGELTEIQNVECGGRHGGSTTMVLAPEEGNLYVVDLPSEETDSQFHQFIRDSETGELTAMSPAYITYGAFSPERGAMVIRPDGRGIYVTAAKLNKILEFPITRLTGNITQELEKSITSTGDEPSGIAITPDGKNVYVACNATKELACLATE
jgi:DNA-binding beta-propeller fold protein YncE